MKSRPPHQRLFCFLLAALALTCVISPFLTLGADWFMTQWPALMPERIPFHRTFNRAFLVGAVLSFAAERTGALYLSIGLHAGWVFGLKTLLVFGEFKRKQLGWLFRSSDPKIVSGVVAWTAILLTGAAVFYLTKSRAVRSSDLPGAITA